jgi:hypothetical protein
MDKTDKTYAVFDGEGRRLTQDVLTYSEAMEVLESISGKGLHLRVRERRIGSGWQCASPKFDREPIKEVGER